MLHKFVWKTSDIMKNGSVKKEKQYELQTLLA